MALSQARRDNINSMGVNSGKVFLSEKQRIATSNKDAYLIIGLGGSGVTALIETKGLINSVCKLEAGKDLPENIRMLAFETDDSVRSTAKSSAKTGEIHLEVTEFQKIHVKGVDDYFKDASFASTPENMRQFINRDLSTIPAIMDGAGGIRQVGRVMLFDNLKMVEAVLKQEIRNLVADKNVNLTVFVLAGIAGGTGSGTLIDIGYVIRKILKNEQLMSTSKLISYVLMPDINYKHKAVVYNYPNGYAALKELNYLMQSKEMGEYFIQDYGNGFDVAMNENPYDNVHLLASQNGVGQPIADAYHKAASTIAESILSFVSTTTSSKDGGPETSAQSIYSNLTAMSAACKYPSFPASYNNYLSLGSAEFTVPIDKIMLYITSLLFNNMQEMYNAIPDQEQIDDFITKWGTYGTLNVNISPNLFGDREIDKNTLPNIWNMINTRIQHMQEQKLLQEKQRFENLMPAFDQLMKIEFNDNGPIYASRLLNPNVSSGLSGVIEILESQRDEMANQQINFKQKSEDLRQALNYEISKGIGLLHSGKKISEAANRYLECIANVVQAEACNYLFNEIAMAVNNRNNSIFEIIVNVLTTMKDIFSENANILTTTSKTTSGDTTIFSWKTIEIPEIAEDLKGLFTDPDKIARTMENFKQSIYDNMEAWIKEDADYRQFISEFIGSEFGDMINKSVEDYLKLKYRQSIGQPNLELSKITMHEIVFGNEQQIGLAETLLFGAETMFYTTPTFKPNLKPTHYTIAIPQSCTELKAEFENYLQTDYAGHYQLLDSTMQHRIIVTAFLYGLPLSGWSEIETAEKQYEDYIKLTHKNGLHLRMADSRNLEVLPENTLIENWLELPNLYLESAWPKNYFNQRTKEANDKYLALFDELLARNIVKVTDHHFNFVITKDLDLSPIIAEQKLLDAEGNDDRDKLEQAIAELEQLLSTGLEQINDPLHNSFSISTNGYHPNAPENNTEEYIKTRNGFIYRYHLVKRMEKELAKYQEIERTIADLKSRLSKLNREDYILELMTEALYLGYIQHIDDTLYYIFASDLEAYQSAMTAANSDKMKNLVYFEFENNASREIELLEQLLSESEDFIHDLEEDVKELRTSITSLSELRTKAQTLLAEVEERVIFWKSEYRRKSRGAEEKYNQYQKMESYLKPKTI